MSHLLSGLRAWVWQRGTAIYIGLFLLYLFWRLLVEPPASHAAWRGWLEKTPVWLATVLFFGALLLHAWIGVRDVVIDYVKPAGLRLLVLTLVLLFLLANGLWLASLLLGLT
ncbi:MAG TPA: succinate dehydrogenase, hydrophobic membrane anchor protein [Chromatiaceae bacterium]|nr:succinate dehydrogenase, hydrophobic membrane anchor protein [Chromatiaceae bacterium]